MPLLDHFGLIAPYYDRIFQVGELERLMALIRPRLEHVLWVAGGDL